MSVRCGRCWGSRGEVRGLKDEYSSWTIWACACHVLPRPKGLGNAEWMEEYVGEMVDVSGFSPILMFYHCAHPIY